MEEINDKKNLAEDLKRIEEKYDIDITYIDKHSVKDAIKCFVISIITAAIIVGGTWIVAEKIFNSASDKSQQEYIQMIKYNPGTNEIICNNINYKIDKIWLLFDFENKEIIYCTRDFDVKQPDGEYYDIFYSIKTGEQVFAYNKFDENSESYKMVKEYKVGFENFEYIVSNLSVDKTTGEIKGLTLNIYDPEYRKFVEEGNVKSK